MIRASVAAVALLGRGALAILPNVLFQDDFSGSGSPSNDWIIDTGRHYVDPQDSSYTGPENWGTNEVESMTSDLANLRQFGGSLFITPLKTQGRKWTSGRIETSQSWAAASNSMIEFEIRFRLADENTDYMESIWPAIWLLSEDYRSAAQGDPAASPRTGKYWNWPAVGEIDLMENIDGNNVMYHTLHCTDCNPPNGYGQSETFTRGVFHTITLRIDRTTSPESITWYLDGSQSRKVNSDDAQFPSGSTSWEALAHSPKFVILDVAVGGYWPRYPTGRTRGGPNAGMEIDYVVVSTSS